MRTRIGPASRWFIAGSHASRPRARQQFQELRQEFPGQRLIPLPVMTVHDTETGRFHDRILDARGLAPLIDRGSIGKLTPAVKEQIAKAREWQTRPARPAPVGPEFGWWLAGGCAAPAVAALSLLR